MSLIIAAPRRASDGSGSAIRWTSSSQAVSDARYIDGEQRQDRVAAFAEIGEAGEIDEHRAGDEEADDRLLRLGVGADGQIAHDGVEAAQRHGDRGKARAEQREAEPDHDEIGARAPGPASTRPTPATSSGVATA